MKSLVLNIRDYFNRRTRAGDIDTRAAQARQQLIIDNASCAARLMKNEDFALLFNLYRFSVMSQLEDVKTDAERIELSYYIAGVRDFVAFIEKTEHLSNVLNEKLKAKEKV